MKKGDRLQLSAKGLNWLSGRSKKEKIRLRTLRFEFRGESASDPSCFTVKRLSKKPYYQTYHKSFLELVSI